MMSVNVPDVSCYLVDIDGTLTDYRKNALLSCKLLHYNFLFPIICDLMIEKGWDRKKAEDAILELTQRIIFWDYTDFIAEFELPAKEAFRRMKLWHRENIVPCDDGVEFVKELYAQGKKLFIMSNNPYQGCIFKLQAAGLTDSDYSSPYFQRIFGTNLLRGCKSDPNVWKRAIANIPADPADICVIGDNPREDSEIPYSCGILHSFILQREHTLQGIESSIQK